jgi:hypothetical protein
VGNDAYAQRSMQSARIAAQFLQGLIDLPENGMRVLLKEQTGRRGRNAFPATLQENRSNPGFEIAQLLGDGWLRNPRRLAARLKLPPSATSRK